MLQRRVLSIIAVVVNTFQKAKFLSAYQKLKRVMVHAAFVTHRGDIRSVLQELFSRKKRGD